MSTHTVIRIISAEIPDAPNVVKDTIADYAMGLPGVATPLSLLAKDFQTASQVEQVVGWPLSEHTLEKAEMLVNRFKDQPHSA